MQIKSLGFEMFSFIHIQRVLMKNSNPSRQIKFCELTPLQLMNIFRVHSLTRIFTSHFHLTLAMCIVGAAMRLSTVE